MTRASAPQSPTRVCLRRYASPGSTCSRSTPPADDPQGAAMRLEGKAAVTGGGTGIGAATAALFRREGADVVIMGRRSEPLAAVANETGAVASTGDAVSAADVAAAVALRGTVRRTRCRRRERWRLAPSPLLETDDAAWAAAIHNNLTTAFVTCRESLPVLLERKGAIVIVSSLAAHFAGPGVVGYTTAKHGLIGLTRSLARDYGPRGVRVNAVSPAWVRTPMANRAMEAIGGRIRPRRRGRLCVRHVASALASAGGARRGGHDLVCSWRPPTPPCSWARCCSPTAALTSSICRRLPSKAPEASPRIEG